MQRKFSAVGSSPIGRKLLLYVVLFSTLITVLVTAVQLYLDYDQDVRLIDATLEQIQEIHGESLSGNVWTADRDAILLQLEGIMRMRDMAYIEVVEGDVLWAAVGNPYAGNTRERIIPLAYSTGGKHRDLGSLKVVASLDGVYQRLWARTVSVVIGNGIKTFIVAGFILWVFHGLVTRHLTSISRYIDQLDLDHERDNFLVLGRPVDKTDPDEFDVVVDGINRLSAKTRATFLELKRSEEKYRGLVTLAQEGIWTIDHNSITTFVNPAMANMLGYSVEEMAGKHLFEFMDDYGIEVATANIRKREKGISEQHDFEFLTKAGKRIYATMETSPIYDDKGEYAGAIAGVINITDRREAEDALKRHKDELESVVRERTQQLIRSNQDLESFSYSVAHDLRGPLRSITGFSQILKDSTGERLNVEEKDFLRRIIRAGKNMVGLIDDILKLAQISQTKMAVSTVDLSKIAGEIVGELTATDRARKAQISIAEGLFVEGDQGLLKIALQNLLDNAWKFSSKQDTTKIELDSVEKNGEIVFYVRDNGVGFNPLYASNLFKTFQRLHRSEEFEGTGVGLSTVERIMHRHGGRVWAESTEGQGATFFFTVGNVTQGTSD